VTPAVAGCMRYARGGGRTDERRVFRQKLRMEAAERFPQGEENTVIAHDLRVGIRSVQRWHKAWSQGGPGALASSGAGSTRATPCKVLPCYSSGMAGAARCRPGWWSATMLRRPGPDSR
jgi:hypothetical protein